MAGAGDGRRGAVGEGQTGAGGVRADIDDGGQEPADGGVEQRIPRGDTSRDGRTVVSVDISSRKLNFKDHIDVRGMRASEALDLVQNFIDDALMVGVGTVSILHGKGTGALKEEIRRYLRTVPEIASAVDEHADRGGAGITIVNFS